MKKKTLLRARFANFLELNSQKYSWTPVKCSFKIRKKCINHSTLLYSMGLRTPGVCLLYSMGLRTLQVYAYCTLWVCVLQVYVDSMWYVCVCILQVYASRRPLGMATNTIPVSHPQRLWLMCGAPLRTRGPRRWGMGSCATCFSPVLASPPVGGWSILCPLLRPAAGQPAR